MRRWQTTRKNYKIVILKKLENEKGKKDYKFYTSATSSSILPVKNSAVEQSDGASYHGAGHTRT